MNKIKLDDLKEGYQFRGETVFRVNNLGSRISFKTYKEFPQGIRLTEYRGDKKKSFLKLIHTPGEGSTEFYEFGAREPLRRK